MTRDKFKLIHSELIMQVQCIESDLKLIYAGMHSGDFEENLDMLERANLGTVIKKLKELDYSDGHPDLSKQDYALLEQIREMLDGLFAKLPDDATPLFHSDQGWQYQHAEYQRLLAEHTIKQSMSKKGNCMDNGAMENFFGRLKVEMFYGEKFESVNAFINELNNYIYYYNNERIP